MLLSALIVLSLFCPSSAKYKIHFKKAFYTYRFPSRFLLKVTHDFVKYIKFELKYEDSLMT